MTRLLLTAAIVFMSATMGLAEMGDDGLHKAPWMRDTFKDPSEDLADANAAGKRLMVILEQRGCIYCKKMHEEVFPIAKIANYIEENFFVVQINMFGDVEVTDFDGPILPETAMVRRCGALFPPSLLFFPEEGGGDVAANPAAVASLPGAFGSPPTCHMLNWIIEHGYAGEESFQKYHARKFAEQS